MNKWAQDISNYPSFVDPMPSRFRISDQGRLKVHCDLPKESSSSFDVFGDANDSLKNGWSKMSSTDCHLGWAKGFVIFSTFYVLSQHAIATPTPSTQHNASSTAHRAPHTAYLGPIAGLRLEDPEEEITNHQPLETRNVVD